MLNKVKALRDLRIPEGKFKQGEIFPLEEKKAKRYAKRGWVMQTKQVEPTKTGYPVKQEITLDPPEHELNRDSVTHVGGGWFSLPNGEKIRGREQAEVQLAKLNKDDE